MRVGQLREGTVSAEDVKAIHANITRELEESFEQGKQDHHQKRDWLESFWSGFKSPDQMSRIYATGVAISTLERVGQQICTLPENFNVHRGVRKVYETRRKMFESGEVSLACSVGCGMGREGCVVPCPWINRWCWDRVGDGWLSGQGSAAPALAADSVLARRPSTFPCALRVGCVRARSQTEASGCMERCLHCRCRRGMSHPGGDDRSTGVVKLGFGGCALACFVCALEWPGVRDKSGERRLQSPLIALNRKYAAWRCLDTHKSPTPPFPIPLEAAPNWLRGSQLLLCCLAGD